MGLVAAIAFFGAGMALLFATGRLLRERTATDVAMSCAFAIFSLRQLFITALLAGWMQNAPGLFLLHVGFAFWLGPVLYLYANVLLEEDKGIPSLNYLHLAPGLIYAAVIAATHGYPPDLGYVQDLLPNFGLADYRYVLHLSMASFLVYSTLIAVRYVPALRVQRTSSRRNRQISILVILVALAAAAAIATVVAAGSEYFYQFLQIESILITASLAAIYLLHESDPTLFADFTFEARRKRYKRSHLESTDLKNLEQQLREVMEEEKLFKDEALTLKTLAQRLHITPHQLSEYLNNHRTTSFSDFMNSYRVAESKRLLASEPDASTMTIGFRAGFNSTSSFYAAFSREVGMSPANYRKQQLGS